MAQIKVMDLGNDCSLSELSYEDINVVRGGAAAALALTRNPAYARAIYIYVLARTGSRWRARAASLSTSD